MTLYLHEMKMNRKSFIVWTASIALLCFGMLLLYGGLKDSLDEMSDMYANLGSFSKAMGLDKLSINTMEGYYATEIGIMFGLGATMFAAFLGTGILAKEEEGHTSDFLLTLPMGRVKMVLIKYAAMVTMIVLLNIICAASFLLAFQIMGYSLYMKSFWIYHLLQILMQVEVGSICFLMSAMMKRKMTGIGMGIVLLLYAADIMCRIVPAIKNLKYVTPFYYSNAADIFAAKGVEETSMLFIAVCVIGVSIAGALGIYQKRDLAV
jgi:ABC-2 type transport system permease protein